MAIEFNCPHCGVLYKLDEKFAGKTGKCKNAKCQKPILIPYQSTVSVASVKEPIKPVDAEALAAAAFAEERPPPEQASPTPQAGPTKKIAVVCNSCDHHFDADFALAGKNSPCPECGKIIRIPRPVEQKAADWRTGNNNRPSLAKVDEPAPQGVWDVQRKGVSGEALRKAGADDVDEPEEPGERRLRRIKQALYGLALVGLIAFIAIAVRRSMRESKQEKWMDLAVSELEKGTQKPELLAAIHCQAGEYGVRAADGRDKLQAAIDFFNKSRDELQAMSPASDDRNAMLIELGASLATCGGTPAEINDEKRLPWDQVHPLIRKCVDKIPPQNSELRRRSLKAVTRALAARDQGRHAATIARNASGSEEETPEALGRVGIELALAGKREQAEQICAKLSSLAQPAATALWLGTHREVDYPPRNLSPVPGPQAGPKGITRETRLAYAEGRALQDRFAEARQNARLPGALAEQVEALNRVAAIANSVGKPEEAASIMNDVNSLAKSVGKGAALDPWLLIDAVEQAARAGKNDVAAALTEAIPEGPHRSWAKLGALRAQLAARPDAKPDDAWVETPSDPAQLNLAQGLALTEAARRNAALGEASHATRMERLPGLLKPFGLAGTALGNQDRDLPARNGN
jgi:predicted RNA-binding Zn-ribbon protein involved in translation (DUF1610 family)